MNVLRLSIFVLLLFLTACGSDPDKDVQLTEQPRDGRAQNIILLIGDGMGLTQISAAMARAERPLELERFESVGLIKTSSAVESITDSAAGATAFSTGVKTRNGAIGLDENGGKHETILEFLGNNGYATGLIATSTITHATPASFYAHEESRQNYYAIAADMKKAPLDLFIGGGRNHFIDRTDPMKGKPDDRDLIAEMTKSGFTFINELKDLRRTKGKVGLFIADEQPEPVLKGRGDVLPRSLPVSIAHLRSRTERGFFLMVEGSQIDWGGHENVDEYVFSELYDFDAAIGKALDFAQADRNTLVVVTADHETGGLTMTAKSTDDEKGYTYDEHVHTFSTQGHTATMVPVFAYGPGAELFSGVYENTEIHTKMLKALGKLD